MYSAYVTHMGASLSVIPPPPSASLLAGRYKTPNTLQYTKTAVTQPNHNIFSCSKANNMCLKVINICACESFFFIMEFENLIVVLGLLLNM